MTQAEPARTGKCIRCGNPLDDHNWRPKTDATNVVFSEMPLNCTRPTAVEP